MIKIIWQLRRNPELSVKEFSDYWWNVHVPLLKSIMPDLVHYVGCFPIASHDATLVDGDAIVELGFPTAESMQTTFSTVWMVPERIASSEHLLSLPPEWEAVVRVVDAAGSAPAEPRARSAARTDSHEPLPEPGQFRAISRVRRHPDLTPDEFQAYVVDTHLPLVRERLPSLRRLVAGFPLEETSVDAVLEYTFDDLETLTREMQAPLFLDAEYERSAARAFDTTTLEPFVVGVVDGM